MPQSFKIISKFQGYRAKTDDTKIPGGYLVQGSQNVEMTDADTVALRNGYTLFGAADATLNAIVSSYEWQTHRGVEHPLRGHGLLLQYHDSNDAAWVTLEQPSTFASARFQYAEFWDATTEVQDLLLFVNGESSIFMWSGGTTTFASATATTITKEGTTTWAEEGFLTAGTRRVVIEGVTYTYTGGEGTTALTGVTPDPTVAGHTVGISVAQQIRDTANSSITGLPNSFSNDLIATLDNHVYVGDLESREVYVSKNTTYLDFSFSAPRVPGEGALLTFDQTSIGFIVQEQDMYITSGKDFWYRTRFVTSDDLVNESLNIERLKTTTQQAAVSQSAMEKVKNNILLITNEPTLDSLGRMQNFATPQSKPISDPIKKDFDTYDFTDAHIKYYKNNIYVAVPAESLLLKFNIDKGYWEAPWVLPAGRLAIISGELHLHSNAVPETYKLFQGFNDNGNAIKAVARFSYQNWGKRASLKTHNEWFSEGYIATNTLLTLTLNYDYKGFTQVLSGVIDGDTTNNYIYVNQSSGSLGKKNLGKSKLGGAGAGDDTNKFRVIDEMQSKDYYEIQPEYSTNDIDKRWEILAFGANVKISNTDNNFIKKSIT